MLQLYNQNGIAIGNTDLTFVNGSENAMKYPMNPNSRMPIFEKDDDIVYIVSSDASGFKSMRRFRLIEEPELKPEDKFVGIETFNELKGEIADVKQSMGAILDAITSNKRSNSKPKQQKRFNSSNRNANTNGVSIQSSSTESEPRSNFTNSSAKESNIK